MRKIAWIKGKPLNNRKVYFITKRRIKFSRRNRALKGLGQLRNLIQEQTIAKAQFQAQLQLQNQLQNQLQAQTQAQAQAQTQLQNQLQGQSQLQAQLQAQAQAQAQLQAQLQAQAQEQEQLQDQFQAQQQSETVSISDVGNPEVIVRTIFNTIDPNLVRASAFRAVITSSTNVTVSRKVLFPVELFDLANEYNPITSAFIPTAPGVYCITADVEYLQNIAANRRNSTIFLRIVVNGSGVTLEDDSRVNPIKQSISQTVQATEILKLNAGDVVEVFISGVGTESFTGSIQSGSFAAVRQPSPII